MNSVNDAETNMHVTTIQVKEFSSLPTALALPFLSTRGAVFPRDNRSSKFKGLTALLSGFYHLSMNPYTY